MPVIPFGEWLPDQPDYSNPGSPYVLNVVPRTPNGYGAFLGPQPHPSLSLPGQVVGSYSFMDADGAVYNFAATGTNIYLQRTGDTAYSDVSKDGGYSTSPPPDGAWRFTSFGGRIIATNYNDPIQTFLVGTDTKFSDLSAAAPHARYCAVIRDFLIVGDTFDPVDGARPYRVWWPALGDPLNWPPPGTNEAVQVQSDFQDLQQTDLGNLNGLVGGHLSASDGAAIMQTGVYRIMYVGSPAIFDFAVAQGSVGSQSPSSIVLRQLRVGTMTAVVYFLGQDGFYAFDGSTSVPIGAQKIDQTFFADADQSLLRNVMGTYDPQNRLVFWFYTSQQQTAPVVLPPGAFNRALCFNTEINRWSQVDLSATPVEWVTGSTYSSTGYNLDELDPFGTIDTLPYSLDSRYWMGSGAQMLAWFTTDHQLAYSAGAPMTPTLDTTEQQLFPGKRSRIISTRPIADGGPALISIGRRDRTQDVVTFTTPSAENVIGECPQRATGRYTRFRLTFTPRQVFKQIEGIDVTARPEGFR